MASKPTMEKYFIDFRSPSRPDDQDLIPDRGTERYASSLPRPGRLQSAPPCYQLGTEDCLPEVKRPGREPDHSLPSSADVKNATDYISISVILFY
jgi:hypothetical protein